MNPSFVLGSRNAKKLQEMVDLLTPLGAEVVSVSEFPDVPEVVEDGETFQENACLKARVVAETLSRWTIAEDSGLAVDALNGAPGIYSARYAGEPCDDLANNRKLVQALTDIPPEKRSAHYVSHLALADPAGTIRAESQAICRGRIIDEPRGSNGFGYDPHFLVLEYHCTFGELSPLVKQHLSHRARAFTQFLPQLVALFPEQASSEQSP